MLRPHLDHERGNFYILKDKRGVQDKLPSSVGYHYSPPPPSPTSISTTSFSVNVDHYI